MEVPVTSCRVHLAIWILSLFLLICLVISIWATTTTISLREQSNQVGAIGQCLPIVGNGDMYGLGIRLGIYIQLIATSIVDVATGNRHTSLSLAPPLLWFLVAMFVALITIMWDPTTYIIESYIITALGNGLTWVLVGGVFKLDALTLSDALITSFARIVVWGLWRITSGIFWWSLSRSSVSYRHVEEGCGPWGWLLFGVELLGNFKVIQRAFNLVSCIAWLQVLVPFVVGYGVFLFLLVKVEAPELCRERNISKGHIFADYNFVAVGELRGVFYGKPRLYWREQCTQRPRFDKEENPEAAKLRTTGAFSLGLEQVSLRLKAHMYKYYQVSLPPTDQVSLTVQPSRSPFGVLYYARDTATDLVYRAKMERFPFLLFWDIISITMTILTVEFTLKLNNIQNINRIDSAGQLVAFITGIGCALLAAANLFAERRKEQKPLNGPNV